MSGPDKVFAITNALIATAEAQGIKADVSITTAVALDVAQAAYPATIASFESGLIPLAAAITSRGGLQSCPRWWSMASRLPLISRRRPRNGPARAPAGRPAAQLPLGAWAF